MPESPTPTAPPPETDAGFSHFIKWCAANPAAALLVAACVAAMVYFLAFFAGFHNGTETAAGWTSRAWNSENNQEHAWGVLPVVLGLLWYHRGELRRARKVPSNSGLVWALAGVLAFILAVRTLQPRMAIFSLPLLTYGGVRFLWGRETARVLIFPCLFMLFMVPVGGVVQSTVGLQVLVSTAVKALSSLIGVHIEKVGTTLRALDGTFNFDIAEGCSGIHSLMAMTTLSALYVHLTQREWWKQWLIFACSIGFALVGNVGRVFSVVVVARFISEKFAGGLYHDYSGFVFFAVAVGTMVGFSKLLNMDWRRVAADSMKPEAPRKSEGPVSYDY